MKTSTPFLIGLLIGMLLTTSCNGLTGPKPTSTPDPCPKDLLETNNPNQILGNLLSYCFNDELDHSMYNEIEDLSVRNNQNRRSDMKGKARLFVARGKRDQMTPAKLVQFIMQNAKVKNSAIDQVEVYNDFSFITVPFNDAETILHAFQKNSRGRPLVSKAKKR